MRRLCQGTGCRGHPPSDPPAEERGEIITLGHYRRHLRKGERRIAASVSIFVAAVASPATDTCGLTALVNDDAQ